MKTVHALLHRLAWFNLPAALLLGLLQRTPIVRVVAAAADRLSGSPVAALIRAATVSAASLGAMHSLAGATTLVTNSPSPLAATAAKTITAVAFGINGPGVGQPGSWTVGGSIPPGLNFSGLTAPGTVNIANLVLSGTPSVGGNFTVTLQGWENKDRKGNGSPTYTYIVNVAPSAATSVAPTFTAHPASQALAAGASATFSATAAGSPAPTYQWSKDGAPIAAATSSSYTLSSLRSTDAGAYRVVATNSAGSATSNPAQLTVTVVPSTTAPVFTLQPTAQTALAGDSVTFSATASGTPAPAYQWAKDGTPLGGATSSSYTLTGLRITDAGAFSVVATNSAGTATSAAATLTVNSPAGTPTDFGRLVNLSILTNAGTGASVLTMGAVIGGAGSAGSLPLVIRAVGPTLGTAFGIAGVLADPVMTINAQNVAAPIAVNDNWDGSTATRAAFTSVGAFVLPTGSLDCAYVPPTPGLTAGGYTVQVAGTTSASGLVIAEIYDAAGAARTAATPRLINLSTLAQIDPGATLAVGFVIGGTAPCRVLVRAVGPTLGTAFGIGGVMADPGLVLFSNDTGQQIGANDDWGGTAALAAAMSSVGAFALGDPASRDAGLVVTLPPGAYSVRVSGKNSTGGTAIVEVYESR
jgi:hypothetical protein